jgi:hypothetical protein
VTQSDEFQALEGFSVAARCITFHAVEVHDGKKSLRLKTPLLTLGRENLHEIIHLLMVDLLLKRHEEAGMSPLTLVFWNLVLQDQMVAEGIPSLRLPIA